jgi:alkylation response protein AidB-like acyl-CoA dehydrogenase
MAFEAKNIFESDFSESADRFAQDLARRIKDTKLSSSTPELYNEKWQEAIDQGWQNCLIPEKFGGIGGSLIDFCALLEGANRHALPLPIAAGFGLPVTMLLALSNEKALKLVSETAQGNIRFQPVILDREADDLSSAQDTLCAKIGLSGECILTGRISGVEWVPSATHILLACPFEQDQGSYVVASLAFNDAIQTHSQTERIDGRSTMSFEFLQRPVAGHELLAFGDSATIAVDKTRNMGCLFACVSAAAAMGMSIEKTLIYLRDRQQFGVSLSTFQALRHYMASVYSKYECYRSLVRTVVIDAANSGEIDDYKLSLLKIYLGQVGRFIAHTVLQVHGGMGMTEDLFASKLNKIILMAGMEYGDGQHHIDKVLDFRVSPITGSTLSTH